MRKRIAVLGSTGSIGVQALDILSKFPEYFEIVALATRSSVDILSEQVSKFNPTHVAIIDQSKADEFKRSYGSFLEVVSREEGLIKLAGLDEVDIVLNAVVGFAGLKATLAALGSGKDLALANKESLVAAGELVMKTAKMNRRSVIPIDSEHSAIFQCVSNPHKFKEIRKIYLTASGGPFREWDKEKIKDASVKDALNHPNWDMGKKITIDSATMMNKGLEVIEAGWLFDLTADKIEVIIHPQSIVHSLVEFLDGSVLAQMSNPDMRLPILYAFSHPDRLPTDIVPLDLLKVKSLTFEEPDYEKFPCLRFAYNAMKVGGTMPAVLNAANEVAVSKFLNHEISFGEIPSMIETAMSMHKPVLNPTLQDIIEADLFSRKLFNT